MVRPRMMRSVVSFALVALFVGCSDDGSAPRDAAAAGDTGATDGGGALVDMGMGRDGGATGVDGGSHEDAGVVLLDAGLLANGASCASGSVCATGFCVDDVCCENACTGDCVACSAGKTGGADGTCRGVSTGTDPDAECDASACAEGVCDGSGACTAGAPINEGSTCRAAASDCDAVEVCTSGVCPVDGPSPAETVCRAAAGVCDMEEACDGISFTCPADLKRTGSVCRASAGDCDLVESCDGVDDDCPSDTFSSRVDVVPACLPYLCYGASASCPGSCVAHSDCGPGAVCTTGGACVVGKRVFVTFSSYQGNLGGLSGADDKCQARATAGGLTGTYRAWLSDATTSAASRLNHSTAPYYRVDGVTPRIVANNWNDLIDGTTVAIATDEFGDTRGNAAVWTGTYGNGAIGGPNCLSWATGDAGQTGRTGYSSSATTLWTDYAGNTACNVYARLYCIQQ